MKFRMLGFSSWTFQDILEQIEAMEDMYRCWEGGVFLKFLERSDAEKKQSKVVKSIIQSMTKEERKNPHIITERRIFRIARGSGRRVEDVQRIVNCFAENL